MKTRWVNWILALYPQAWRRRYGAELAQLLDDLNAERRRSALRQALGLLINAAPIHIEYRPIASSILAFCVGSLIATVVLPGDVATTKQAGIVETQTNSPQVLIIRGPHSTIIMNDRRATGAQTSKPDR